MKYAFSIRKLSSSVRLLASSSPRSAVFTDASLFDRLRRRVSGTVFLQKCFPSPRRDDLRRDCGHATHRCTISCPFGTSNCRRVLLTLRHRFHLLHPSSIPTARVYAAFETPVSLRDLADLTSRVPGGLLRGRDYRLILTAIGLFALTPVPLPVVPTTPAIPLRLFLITT